MRGRGSARIFATLAVLFALFHGRQAEGAVLAVDPVADVLLLEESSEVLCSWFRVGAKNLPLVLVSDRPGFHSTDFTLDADATVLREALEGSDCAALRARTAGPVRADTLWTAGDFAFAGYQLGIVKEVWWVVPSRSSLENQSLEDVRSRLRGTHALPEEFLESLRRDGKAFLGNHRGLPVRLITLGDIPPFEHPVLLSVDTAFFLRLHDNPVREGMLDLLGWFFAALRGKKLAGEHVALALGFQAPLQYRYIRDRLRDLLSNPKRYESGPPEAWKLQQRVEYLEYMLARDEAFAAAEKLADLEPTSPVPWYDGALIATLRKDAGQAQGFLEESVARDPEYRTGYVELGRQLTEMGLEDEGLALLTSGHERYPDDIGIGIPLAGLLTAQGRHEEALGVIAPLAEKNALVPALHAARAKALHAAGKAAEAQRVLDRFRETAPEGLWRRTILEAWTRLPGDGVSPPEPNAPQP